MLVSCGSACLTVDRSKIKLRAYRMWNTSCKSSIISNSLLVVDKTILNKIQKQKKQKANNLMNVHEVK